MKINNPKSPARKIILITALAVLIAIPGYLVTAQYNNIWPFHTDAVRVSSSDNTDEDRPVNDIDYSEPSDDYLAQNQAKKDKQLQDAKDSKNDQSSAEKPSDGKSKALVNVSYADINKDKLEVRAFVTNVIEGNGICTATVSKAGEKTITASKPAFIDASSSICQPIYIPKSKLSSGAWQLVVDYSSPDFSGKTNSIGVEVK